MATYTAYYVATSGEYGLSIFAFLILWIFCLVGVRRQKDPLRMPFLFLKLAIPGHFLYSAAETILFVAIIIRDISKTYNHRSYQISIYIASLDILFQTTGDSILLLCIVELCLSFLRALGQQSSSLQNVSRITTLAAIIILTALSVTAFSLYQKYIHNVFNSVYRSNRTLEIVYGSWQVLHFVVAMGVTALAVLVFRASLRQKQYQKLTRRLLTLAILNNIRTIWRLYVAACYQLRNRFPTPIIFVNLNPILYLWVTLIIYSLLTDIGFRKRGGLWSDLNIDPPQLNTNSYRPWNESGWNGYRPPQVYGEQLGSYNLYQQPAQVEVMGSNPPVWRELAAPQQQQPLLGQQGVHGVSQVMPVEAAGQPIASGAPRGWSQQQPSIATAQAQGQGQQVQHIYEVAGIGEQKG